MRKRILIWAVLVGVTLIALARAIELGTTRPPHGPASTSEALSRRVGRLYMAIGRSPTGREIRSAAARYDVAVMNAWDQRAAQEMKRLKPSIVTLVYKDLASTRSYAVHHGHDDRMLPSGVGYLDAHPSWFAQDNAGHRIEWAQYPGHWMMAVWDPAYQRRWVSEVREQVMNSVWDGVFADNDMFSLRPYSDAILKGRSNRDTSDRLIRQGLEHLVTEASRKINAAGKLFVPNVGEARLDLPRWQRATVGGGGMDEKFAHFNTDKAAGYVTDWGRSGWTDQTSELATGLTLLVTRAAPGDEQALRFGLGSALVRSRGRVAWTGDTTADYSSPDWFFWQGVDLGRPLSRGTRRTDGAWWRLYENGIVVVNPTGSERTMGVPTGLCTLDGERSRTTVRVAGHDADMLLRAAKDGHCDPQATSRAAGPPRGRAGSVLGGCVWLDQKDEAGAYPSRAKFTSLTEVREVGSRESGGRAAPQRLAGTEPSTLRLAGVPPVSREGSFYWGYGRCDLGLTREVMR